MLLAINKAPAIKQGSTHNLAFIKLRSSWHLSFWYRVGNLDNRVIFIIYLSLFFKNQNYAFFFSFYSIGYVSNQRINHECYKPDFPYKSNNQRRRFVRSPKFVLHSAVGILLFASSICFDPFPQITSQAQSNDENAIRLLVQKLFESYQQKDLEKLVSVFSEKSPFLAECKKKLQDEFTANEKIVVKSFDIHRTKVDSDRATLRATADLALTRAKTPNGGEKLEKKNRTIQLINESGVWRLWKFAASEEELATAIIAAKTEEERKALMEKEPELITSDLGAALISQLTPLFVKETRFQQALTIDRLVYQLTERIGDQYLKGIALLTEGDIQMAFDNPERSTERALELYQRSLKIGEEIKSAEIIAKSLSGCGVSYHFLGQFDRAQEFYEKSVGPAEELGDPVQLARTFNNLGSIYLLKGNFAKALNVLLRGLKLREMSVSTGGWTGIVTVLSSISKLVLHQGNTEQALMYANRALEAAKKAGLNGEKGANKLIAMAYSVLGNAYSERAGGNAAALEYFQKGLKMVRELDDSDPTKFSFMDQLTFDTGRVYEAEKDYPQAIASYHEAYRLAEKAREWGTMSDASMGLSNVYFELGNYPEAISYARRGTKISVEHNLPVGACWTLVSAAKAYRKLGQLEEAHQALSGAIDSVEQLREQLAGGGMERQLSFEVAVMPYQLIIDLKVEQKRFTEAFSYAQRAKGRTLLELLQGGQTNISTAISAEEREKGQQLSQKVVSLNRQIIDEKLKSQPDKRLLAELEEGLKTARVDFDAFRTNTYAAHPDLRAQSGAIRPVSFDDVASSIPDTKTALLDFIVTDDDVQLFVLTKDASARVALNTYTIEIQRKPLAAQVEQFRRRLANRDFDFQKLSRELYDLLLKPAQKQLQNKTSLIISPDNVLWELPFQILQPQENHYLIEDAAISYAPSLSVLRETQLLRKTRQTPASASLLALGNPTLGKQSMELVKFALMDEELRPLPEAGKQVESLERLYGKAFSKVLTGPAAREGVVKDESNRYRIIHLATHGIFNNANPMYSHVMLSQTPGKNDEDGLLEAWEMMNLKLKADLVVLSACETARGRVSNGEGVIGLTWALFVAGCPTTIVSQWKVESSSTSDLMVEFHKRYKTRFDNRQPAMTTAEALRQASLKLMKTKEYRHPFFWGGFVVIGDGG